MNQEAYTLGSRFVVEQLNGKSCMTGTLVNDIGGKVMVFWTKAEEVSFLSMEFMDTG